MSPNSVCFDDLPQQITNQTVFIGDCTPFPFAMDGAVLSYLILFIIASRPLSTKVNNFLVIYASVQEGKCLWIISNQCFPVLQRVEFFTLISLSVSPAIAVFRAAAPATTNPSQSPLPQLPPKSKTLLNLPNSFNQIKSVKTAMELKHSRYT